MYIIGVVGYVVKCFFVRWYYGCDGIVLFGSVDVLLFLLNGCCFVCFMLDDFGVGVFVEMRFFCFFYVKMYVICVLCGVIVNL